MTEQSTEAHRSWLTRLRVRGAARWDVHADRRARRRARAMGGDPDDAARQAESGNWRGGYFTTKTPPKD